MFIIPTFTRQASYARRAMGISYSLEFNSKIIFYLTIMIASCRDLSVSSMNCSAPPLRMIVQLFD